MKQRSRRYVSLCILAVLVNPTWATPANFCQGLLTGNLGWAVAIREAIRWPIRLGSLGLIDPGSSVGPGEGPKSVRIDDPSYPVSMARRVTLGDHNVASWDLPSDVELAVPLILRTTLAGIYYANGLPQKVFKSSPEQVFRLNQMIEQISANVNEAATKTRAFFTNKQQTEAQIVNIDHLITGPVKLHINLLRSADGEIQMRVWRAYDVAFGGLRDYVSSEIMAELPTLPEDLVVKKEIRVPGTHSPGHAVDYMVDVVSNIRDLLGVSTNDQEHDAAKEAILAHLRAVSLYNLYIQGVHWPAHWKSHGFISQVFGPSFFSLTKILPKIYLGIEGKTPLQTLGDLRRIVVDQGTLLYGVAKRRMLLSLINKNLKPGATFEFTQYTEGIRIIIDDRYMVEIKGEWQLDVQVGEGGEIRIGSSSLFHENADGMTIDCHISPLDRQHYSDIEIAGLQTIVENALKLSTIR